MAKVTFVITDGIDKAGKPIVTGDISIDWEGAPEGSEPTMAILFGTALTRMWRSRALAPLVPLTCGDMMGLKRPIPQPPVDKVA